MKIGYKTENPKVDFYTLDDGALFEYKNMFYIKVNVHKVTECGDLMRRNAIYLENGSSHLFNNYDKVTPVEFVGYAKVREDEN
jgi:hypothetical protein